MTIMDHYRSLSSICSKKLKLILYGKESIALQNEIYSFMQSSTAFGDRARLEDSKSLSQFRLLTHLRTKELFRSQLMTYQRIMEDINNYIEFNTCVGMYDWSCLAKFVLSWQFVGLTLHVLGTDQHAKFRDEIQSMKVFGSFALTELTHGSNIRCIETIATYDPKNKTFILNTPSLDGVKCWVGNLGTTATHSLVFANLYTLGVCHGIHLFIVPVRCPKTLFPLPGVFVGDMGSKLGLHGVDNGFMALNNVKIPKENLLNRYSDVEDDGTFVSQFKDPEKRFSASLGALLMGRVAIVGISVANMKCALVIALRYSAQRRQFYTKNSDSSISVKTGEEKEETAIIEHATQLVRLVPSFAKFFVYERFSRKLFHHFHQNLLANIKGRETFSEQDEKSSRHLHVLSCGAKAVVTSCAQHVIQTCRETCGGHGFLSQSNLGKLRADNDPQLTYEGDNYVLVKQLISFLISSYKKCGVIELFDFVLDCRSEPKPIKSDAVETLTGLKDVLKNLALVVMRRPDHTEHSKIDLSRIVVNLIAFEWYVNWCDSLKESKEKQFLCTIGQLFAVQTLNEYSSYVISGEILPQKDVLYCIQSRVESLCVELKSDLIAAVDSVAPPDFVLNSSLGQSDGASATDVHTNIAQHILNNSNHSRPTWWREAVYNEPCRL